MRLPIWDKFGGYFVKKKISFFSSSFGILFKYHGFKLGTELWFVAEFNQTRYELVFLQHESCNIWWDTLIRLYQWCIRNLLLRDELSFYTWLSFNFIIHKRIFFCLQKVLHLRSPHRVRSLCFLFIIVLRHALLLFAFVLIWCSTHQSTTQIVLVFILIRLAHSVYGIRLYMVK